MNCEECGKKIKKNDTFCPNCGKETAKAGDTPKKNAKKPKKNLKTVLIAIACCIVSAGLAYVFLVLLPDTGNDFWTSAPECTATSSQLEAGVPCDPMELIEVTDDRDREWDMEVAENNIDISKLGTYTVTYLFTSNKTQREVVQAYEVVEGELPQIEQKVSRLNYGKTLEETNWYEITNIKDFEYTIDSSECDYETLGTYPVYINLFNSRDIDETYEYEISVIDKTSPIINCPAQIKIDAGTEVDFMEYATARDNYDGDITDKIKMESNVDINEPGPYTVTYSVEDSSGNNRDRDMEVNIMAGKKDKVNINTWTITIEKHYFTDTISDKGYRGNVYYFYDAPDNYTFLVLTIKTKNNSEENDCFVDGEKERYQADEILTLHIDNKSTYDHYTYELRNDITNSEGKYYVKPTKEKSGYLYFLVPENTKDIEGDLILEVESRSGDDKGKIIYIKLN